MTDPILKRGDSGQYVEQVQQRLEQIGYSVGGVDGDYGRKTVEAVQAFQAAYHLDPSGEIDDVAWGLLFSLEDASPTEHDVAVEGATAEALLDMALHQVNDRYVLGTNADETNPARGRVRLRRTDLVELRPARRRRSPTTRSARSRPAPRPGSRSRSPSRLGGQGRIAVPRCRAQRIAVQPRRPVARQRQRHDRSDGQGLRRSRRRDRQPLHA